MRKEETRVFIVDLVESDIPSMELDPESEYFKEEKFMDEAENQGGVYTLKGFQSALNDGFCLDGCFVYFKDMNWQDFDMYKE